MKGTKITFKGHEYNKDGDRPVDLSNTSTPLSKKEFKKALKDKEAIFIKITDERLYGINKLVFKRKRFLLLEPNPVTFYFSLAFDTVNQLEHAKALFKKALEENKSSDVLFSYVFKVSSVGIIFSFFALEAFSNQMLPDFAKIKYNGKYVKKDDIQRWAPFEDKINHIIPDLTGKNFNEIFPKKIERILMLKKLRDELTHLKEKQKSGFTSYDNIYQDILDLDLKIMVSSVKQFINFYSPRLISNYKGKTSIR